LHGSCSFRVGYPNQVCMIDAAFALRRQEGLIDHSWPSFEPCCDFDAYECSVVVVCR
jgi:hypothetical protein